MVVHSGSSYPLRGMIYLCRHRSLWRHILLGAIVMLIFSLLSLILLFSYAFPAQAEGLSSYMVPWIAWVLAFALTIIEIGTSVLVFSSLFLAYYMEVIFDAVWRQETMGINEEQARQIHSSSVSCLRSFVVLILFRVILLIVTSPLNLIPCLGTLLYVYINGFYYGWSLHCRYFDLIGLSFSQGKHYAEQHRSDYLQFGIVGVLFEMIPIVNLVSPVTNVIGSALWACDIERFQDPISHPRTYLLAPSPSTLEQGQMDYGSTINEKDELPPPTYQQVTTSNLSPSAPICEKQ